MSAGKYNEKFLWLQRSVVKEGTYGQEKETFNNVGELWAYAEQLSASEQLALGMRQSEAQVKIHVRNKPGISFKDQLQDKATGQKYLIDGITTDVNELVILAHTNEDL